MRTTQLPVNGPLSNTKEDPLETEIAAGHMLVDAHLAEKAIAHFRALAERHPREPRAQFALATALDTFDRESEAIPAYAAAIRLRLTGELLARAYLGLGSSLAKVGRHAESVEVLAGGSRRFPEHAPLRAFHALVSARAGKQPKPIVAELLEDLLAHHDMGPYTDSLRRNLDALRKSAAK
jgi:tetratricopeptide (TPR) repeat protein